MLPRYSPSDSWNILTAPLLLRTSIIFAALFPGRIFFASFPGCLYIVLSRYRSWGLDCIRGSMNIKTQVHEVHNSNSYRDKSFCWVYIAKMMVALNLGWCLMWLENLTNLIGIRTTCAIESFPESIHQLAMAVLTQCSRHSSLFEALGEHNG